MKPGRRSLAVALWLAIVGLYFTGNGVAALRVGPEYAPATRAYYGVALAGGAALLVLVLGQWVRLLRGAALRWAELGTLACLAAAQVVGLATSIIPCYSPG